MSYQLTGIKFSLFIHAVMFALIFSVSQLYAIPGSSVAVEIGTLTLGTDAAKNNSQGKVFPQLARPANRNKVANPVVQQKEGPAETVGVEKPVLRQEGEISTQTTVNEPLIASGVVSNNNNTSVVAGPLFNAAYLNNPKPRYPPIARRMKLEGTVVVHVLVNSDGKPENVHLGKSSGSSILDQAALTAVQNWLFVPARQGDKMISAWVDIPLRFQLLD